MGPEPPVPPSPVPPVAAPARKPQSRTVVILGAALAAMLLLWAVGSYVLVTHTPDFGPLPGSPTPSATE